MEKNKKPLVVYSSLAVLVLLVWGLVGFKNDWFSGIENSPQQEAQVNSVFPGGQDLNNVDGMDQGVSGSNTGSAGEGDGSAMVPRGEVAGDSAGPTMETASGGSMNTSAAIDPILATQLSQSLDSIKIKLEALRAHYDQEQVVIAQASNDIAALKPQLQNLSAQLQNSNSLSEAQQTVSNVVSVVNGLQAAYTARQMDHAQVVPVLANSQLQINGVAALLNGSAGHVSTL